MFERLHARRLLFVIGVVLPMLALLQQGCVPALAMGSEATITLNHTVTYQTINGWEATGQAGQIDYSAAFQIYKDTLYDAAVNDLGINRIRLETLRKGPNQSGNGFDLAALDHTIETVVLPLRQRLAARGEKLWVNLCVVGRAYATNPSGANGTGYDSAALELVTHMQSKYGFLPDSWEIALEPDNFGWGDPTNVANALIATAKIFKANGLPHENYFVIPSNTDAGRAINDFVTIMTQLKNQSPPLDNAVRELAYHRYGGAWQQNIQTLANLGQQYGVDTAMLEHIASGYPDLHEDLTVGRNSAWQQFALAYDAGEDGSVYYDLDLGNPSNPKIILTSRAKFLRQYFRYVRSGAVRIGAETNDTAFLPVAFINSASNPVMPGRYVVVVNAARAGSFSIQGLPAGTYGIKYTTQQEYDKDLPDVTLAAGQVLDSSIPGVGVITIYGKGGSAQPSPTHTRTRTPTRTPTKPPNAATPTYTPTPPPGGCASRPAKPVQIDPYHGQVLDSTVIQLQWASVECAAKYKLILRQKKPKGPMILKAKETDTNFETELTDRKKYVWRIKACNAYGCQSSDWWTFKVRTEP